MSRKSEPVTDIKENKVLRRTTDIFLLLMMTVFLFVCGNNGYEGIFGTKLPLFRIIVGGYCAIMLLIIIEGSIIGKLRLTVTDVRHGERS